MISPSGAVPPPTISARGGGRPGTRAATLYTRLLALVSLNRGEVARAVLSFVYLFLIIASYLLIKAIRNALFISEFGALKLPYVMLGIAVLTGGLAAVYIRLARRTSSARLTFHTLLFFAANVFAFWWIALGGHKWLYPIVYVWSGMFGVIGTTQVWTLANDLFTVREAKRAFGVIGAGGILGAVVGGSLAFRLAPILGTTHLLLVVVGLLLAAAATVAVLIRLRTAQVPLSRTYRPPRNLSESVRAISRSGHLRLLAALVFVTAIATTTVDFQFNVVASEKIAGRDALTAFFGAVYGGTSILAFVLQILLTSRFLSHLGVGFSLLLLPLSLLSGTTAMVLSQAIWAGVLLKGSDGALRHSLDRACRELMYLPVSPQIKVQTKSTIDTVLDRLGEGTAGALQLGIIAGLGLGLGTSLALNFVVVGIWLLLATRLKRRYVEQLRQALGGPVSEAEAMDGLAEDADARRTLEGLLATGGEDQKLAALEWAVRARITLDEGLLLSLARGESRPALRRAALAALLGGSDADLPAEALAELEEEGQAALVSAIDVVVEEDRARLEERLEALLGRAGETTRLPLLAFALRRLGPEFEPFARRMFDTLLDADAPPRARRAAVRSLALLPEGSPILGRLEALLLDPDPEVAAAAAEVVARRGRVDLVPRVVELLARARTRPAAREAILSFGVEAADPLGDALKGAPAERRAGVRQQVPRLLGEIGTPRAIEALVEGIRDPDPAVSDRCLATLERLRRRNQDLRPVRGPVFEREIAAQALRYAEAVRLREAIAGDGSGAEDPLFWVRDALEGERARALEAIFAVLSLDNDPSDMRKACLAMRDGSTADRATALELLANVLPRSIEKTVVPLLEHGPAAGHTRGDAAPVAPDRNETLRILAAGRNPWVAACALHAARRLQTPGMAEVARRAVDSRDPLLREEAGAFLSGTGWEVRA